MVNDTTLTASSIRLGKSERWSCNLAPDSRLPENVWAISPGLFSVYVCTGYDANLRYEQTMWTVKRLHENDWLVLGPEDDGLWPITFSDGSTDYAFVINELWDVHDIAKEATKLRADDSLTRAFTFPRAEGAKRTIKGCDEWGRIRTFSAQCWE